jgi:hypothetical protein
MYVLLAAKITMPTTSADEWGSQGVPNSILLTKPFAQLVTAVFQLLNSGTPPINQT